MPVKKAVALFSAISIFAWILPLGNFIKPSQEKTACGGGRAMHMCTMGMSNMHKVPAPEKFTFSDASGVEKTNKSAGGSSGNDVMPMIERVRTETKDSKLMELSLIFPRQLFFSVPSPVPKV